MSQTEKDLREFFEKGYWLQRGEFSPENHVKNIDELCRLFPWDPTIIDALYRILPHFDHIVHEAVVRFRSGALSSQDAFQAICLPIFSYIPESVKRSAWEVHLDEFSL